MNHLNRRRADVVWLGLGAALVGGAAVIGALAGDTERIGNYWLHASIDADGTAQVVEVIDYDFGPRARHGIFRDIPDVDPGSDFEVSSLSAPDGFTTSRRSGGARLKVGDANVTIYNRHRYRIAYPIDTLVVGDRISWNAIGLSWEVPINNAEIHLTTDAELNDLACSLGRSGTIGGCSVDQVEPGHLMVTTTGLDKGEAVTISATRGSALPSSPGVPEEPTGRADDPGAGWLFAGVTAAAGALVTAGVTSRQIRFLGKEQVWEGGAADAAYGPPSGEIAGVEFIDHEQLAAMATIEFESPRGLSAAAGGIIHAEQVTTQHKMAWLLECAIREEVTLDESAGKLTLKRGPADPHPTVRSALSRIFASGRDIELGTYDKAFAKAWTDLGSELDAWRKGSEMWDPAGQVRRSRARLLGGFGVVLGLGIAFLGGVMANRVGLPWLGVVLLGGLLAGASVAGLIRSWELLVRTPEGSARWLQIESFRRFIAASEIRHAEAAAKMGLLRHYTAWAVSIGELDHWTETVTAAADTPGSSVSTSSLDYRFAILAPALSTSTAQTFTAPSSSGGGGGGGGGAGGGGGGGGGGSW